MIDQAQARLVGDTRLVVHGGADDEAVAAVAAAIAAGSVGGSERSGQRRPAWLDAALREGAGGAPAVTPDDLRRPG